MFAYLFITALELVAGIAGLVLVYHVFLSDYVKERREKSNENKAKLNSMNKIACLKLVSNDAKDIEKFIEANAQFLSAEVVNKLVSRIEYLNADKAISDDNNLKTRIDALNPALEQELEEVVPVSKAARKR